MRRELGRQDSNLGSRDQSPLPYRLATPTGQPVYEAFAPGRTYPRLRSPSSRISSTSSRTTAIRNVKKSVTGIATTTSASRPWANATIHAPSRTGPGGSLRPAKYVGGDRQQPEEHEGERVRVPERHRQELDGGEPGGDHDAALAQLRVEAARAGRRHAPPVAIDDHDVLGTDLVAHGLILAPASPCGRRVTADPRKLRRELLVRRPRGALVAEQAEDRGARSAHAGGQRAAARGAARAARAIGGQSASAAAARSFSTRAASSAAPGTANGRGRQLRDALPRSRGRPVARVDLGRARAGRPATRARPRPAPPSGHGSSSSPRPRASADSRPEAKNGTSEPTCAASASSSPGVERLAAASRSPAAERAPASALPPPSPAPTGASFSMLHPPAGGVAGARRQQLAARASRAHRRRRGPAPRRASPRRARARASRRAAAPRARSRARGSRRPAAARRAGRG